MESLEAAVHKLLLVIQGWMVMLDCLVTVCLKVTMALTVALDLQGWWDCSRTMASLEAGVHRPLLVILGLKVKLDCLVTICSKEIMVPTVALDFQGCWDCSQTGVNLEAEVQRQLPVILDWRVMMGCCEHGGKC